MVDFAQALNIGLDMGQQAERNSQEITEVFNQLNSQLRDATDGKISINRGSTPDFQKSLSQLLPRGLKPVKESVQSRILSRAFMPETQLALVAENPKKEGGERYKLANWSEGPKGYPCRIELPHQVLVSDDKEALERTLAKLLKDPTVGQKLNKLISE